jgi:hypothetical protein
MKKLNSLLSYFKKFSYGDRIHPTRDWFIMLTVSLGILVVGALWHLFIFTELANGKNLGAPQTASTTEAVNPVSSIQQLFQKRATGEGNYQNTYTFVDPSLPGS